MVSFGSLSRQRATSVKSKTRAKSRILKNEVDSLTSLGVDHFQTHELTQNRTTQACQLFWIFPLHLGNSKRGSSFKFSNPFGCKEVTWEVGNSNSVESLELVEEGEKPRMQEYL